MIKKCPECGTMLARYNRHYICKECNIVYKVIKDKISDYKGEL